MLRRANGSAHLADRPRGCLPIPLLLYKVNSQLWNYFLTSKLELHMLPTCRGWAEDAPKVSYALAINHAFALISLPTGRGKEESIVVKILSKVPCLRYFLYCMFGNAVCEV